MLYFNIEALHTWKWFDGVGAIMSIIEFPRPPVTLDITMLGDYLLLGYLYCYRRHYTDCVIRTTLAVCIVLLNSVRLMRRSERLYTKKGRKVHKLNLFQRLSVVLSAENLAGNFVLAIKGLWKIRMPFFYQALSTQEPKSGKDRYTESK